MGFGTLFIGYFFLVNISYFAYTDIISAMVMLIGLYQLSGVNRQFRYASYASAAFAFFALAEIALALTDALISPAWVSTAMPYLGAVHYLFIFIITIFVFRGIEQVAMEVEAYPLSKSAKAAVPLSAIFAVASVFEIPYFAGWLGAAAAYVYFAILLAVVISVLSNLITVYKAYMQICMPDEEKKKKKPSRFKFMDKFYDSIERGSREYAEYKQGKKKEKNKKGKK